MRLRRASGRFGPPSLAWTDRQECGSARARASQSATIRSIAAKIGCGGQTLRHWARQAERDRGERAGLTSKERERIKALEREMESGQWKLDLLWA